jgi:hypothetical protein
LVVSSECRNNGLGRNLLLKLKERAYEISEENDTVIDSRFLVNLTNPKLTKFYIDANIKINDYNPKIKGGRGLVNWDGLGGKKLDTEPKSLEEFVEKVKGPIYESKTGIENVLEKERAHEFLLKISDNDQNLNDLFNSIIRDNLYSLTDVFEKDGKFYYRFESPENLHSKANIALKLGNISVMSITSPLKELEDVKALKKIFKLMPNLSYLLDGHRLGFMADMNAVNYYDGLPAESTAWVEKDSESAKKFEEEYGKTAKNLSFLSKKGLTRVDEYMNFDDRLTMAAYGPDALKEIEEIEQMMRQEAAQAAEF